MSSGPGRPDSDRCRCPPRCGQGPCFRGWRWICPGCGQRLRTIYYPLSCLHFTEWLGEEAHLLQTAGTDTELEGITPPPANFACHRCHRICFWSAADRSRWNELVSYYMTGGLLYGHEVPRPDDLPPTRQDEVGRLLSNGIRYAAIAKEMGIKLSTVQGQRSLRST